MLENLASKINNIIKKVSNKTKISDYDIKLILKDFRKTLLDADVSWIVTKNLIDKIKEKLINLEITKKVSPKDLFLKIVIDEFLDIFSNSNNINYNKLFNYDGFCKILFFGLNGVGKTTNLVKLSNLLKIKTNKSILLVSCDVYRPAAIDQLKILSDKIGIECFLKFDLTDSPYYIVEKSIEFAKLNKYDYLIIDSAGRSSLDDFMMKELIELFKLIKPDFSFLVLDVFIGQSGIKNINNFLNSFNFSGFFLTKMDSDARGGILLSLSFLTKKPIYFLGIGEKISDISYFYPDRIVSRILGFGDVSTLIEDLNDKIKKSEDECLVKKDILSNFDLDDFKHQVKNILELGGFSNIMDKLPGGFNFDKSLHKIDDIFFQKIIIIINSMTKKEKKFPNLLNGSRKRRISNGSGTTIQDINRMLKYFYKIKDNFSKVKNENQIFSKFKKFIT